MNATTQSPELQRPRRLDEALLDHPVEGVNLTGSSLGDEIREGDHFLVFLRHFG